MNILGAHHSGSHHSSTLAVSPPSNGAGAAGSRHANPLGISPKPLPPHWDNRATSAASFNMGDARPRNGVGAGVGSATHKPMLVRSPPSGPRIQLDLRGLRNGTHLEETTTRGAPAGDRESAEVRQQQLYQQEQERYQQQQQLNQQQQQRQRTFYPQDGQSLYTSPDIGTSIASSAAAPRQYQSSATPTNLANGYDQYSDLRSYYRQSTVQATSSRNSGASLHLGERLNAANGEPLVNAYQYADLRDFYRQNTAQSATLRSSGDNLQSAVQANVSQANVAEAEAPVAAPPIRVDDNVPERTGFHPEAPSAAAYAPGRSPSNPLDNSVPRPTSPELQEREMIQAALRAAEGWQASEDREMGRSEHDSPRDSAPHGVTLSGAASPVQERDTADLEESAGSVDGQTDAQPHERVAMETEPSVEMATEEESFVIAETEADVKSTAEPGAMTVVNTETPSGEQGLQLEGLAGA